MTCVSKWTYAAALIFLSLSQTSLAFTFDYKSKYKLELISIDNMSDREALYGRSSLTASTLSDDDLMTSSPLFFSTLVESEVNLEEETSYFDIRRLRADFGWKDTFELGAGQDVIIWGQGDGINPTDVINAENFSDYLVFDKDRRKIARPMGIMSVGISSMKLTVVAMPTLQRHTFPNSQTSAWCKGECQRTSEQGVENAFKALGTDAKIRSYDLPERRSEFDLESRYETLGDKNEFAARLQFPIGPFDFSLMAHDGFERFPVYQRKMISERQILFEEVDGRRQAFGGDLSFSVFDFVLRAEGIYKMKKTFMINPKNEKFQLDRDGLVKGDEFEGLVGIDRDDVFGMFLSAQYYMRSDELEESLVLRQQGNELATFLARLSLFEDDLELEYRVLVDLEGESALHQPAARYFFNDFINSGIQGNIFEGPDGTMFGDYYANTGALMTLGLVF